MPVINIGDTMRKYAKLDREKYYISPAAITELQHRLEMFIELNMEAICKIAKAHKRMTIRDDDITEFFGFTKNEIGGE